MCYIIILKSLDYHTEKTTAVARSPISSVTQFFNPAPTHTHTQNRYNIKVNWTSKPFCAAKALHSGTHTVLFSQKQLLHEQRKQRIQAWDAATHLYSMWREISHTAVLVKKLTHSNKCSLLNWLNQPLVTTITHVSKHLVSGDLGMIPVSVPRPKNTHSFILTLSLFLSLHNCTTPTTDVFLFCMNVCLCVFQELKGFSVLPPMLCCGCRFWGTAMFSREWWICVILMSFIESTVPRWTHAHIMDGRING